MSKRTRTILAAALALSLVALAFGAAGCTPKRGGTASASDTPVKGGTLSYYIGEPAYIDPYNTQESEGTNVEQSLFDSLTAINPLTSKLEPAAAESWKANSDGTVWTFKLRKGAKFHDGTPVGAKDFKYAWERIANPATDPKNPSVISYHLSPVKGFQEMADGKATDLTGVKVIDDLTLEVTLTESFADFEYVVAHPALAPVPKAAVEKDPKAFAEAPVGNGPFKMSGTWKHDQYIKVVRFDGYYGTKANLDGIDFKIFKDEDTAFREFEAGNIDFTSIPTGKIGASKTKYGVSADGYTVNPKTQVLLGAETAVYYMLMNNTDPILKNPKVRAAISMAINRQALCDTLYEGTRKPATGIVPPGIVGFQPNAWAATKYDLQGAKKMLADAGYPGGAGIPEFSLSFNTGQGHEKVMELVGSDLAKIGIKTKPDGAEWAQYLKQLDAGTYQIGRLGWIADYPIFDNFINPIFQSKSGDNKSKFVDASVDTAILDARKTTDGAKRVAAYQDIEKKIGEQTPVAPLTFYAHRHVGSARVHNLIYSPMGLGAFDKCWIVAPAAKK